MSLSLTIELSDNDLDHFAEVLQKARQVAHDRSSESITQTAAALIERATSANAPDFVKMRLSKLDSLIKMVHDHGWALGTEDRERVLTALMYFAEPNDVIPDHIPVVGYLDDAIMIELCVRELKHEVEAYEDYVRFRELEANKRGVEASSLGREDWLEDQRQELHQRMSRRRTRDRGTGGGLFRVC